jgi:uncharacterized protein YhfF
MEQDHLSVKKMWENYLTSIGESIAYTNKKCTSWHFCDDEESANNLAKLVREGIKRGTTSLRDLYDVDNDELPMEGDYSVITDWNGILYELKK